jgi:hypothetical protein
MNRMNFLAACVLGTAVLLSATAGGQENKVAKAVEMEWAKGVAEDFLAAAISGDSKSAEALVDASLKAAHMREGENVFSSWIQYSIGGQQFTAAAIAKEAMSPDQDEAVFRGTMQRNTEPKELFDFSLRVVKEKDGGKWRVSMFRFNPAGKGK